MFMCSGDCITPQEKEKTVNPFIFMSFKGAGEGCQGAAAESNSKAMVSQDAGNRFGGWCGGRAED
jgi:hypothetical protein